MESEQNIELTPCHEFEANIEVSMGEIRAGDIDTKDIETDIARTYYNLPGANGNLIYSRMPRDITQQVYTDTGKRVIFKDLTRPKLGPGIIGRTCVMTLTGIRFLFRK